MSAAPLMLLALCGSVRSAGAQWLPDYQVYSVQRVGLYGLEQTGSGGTQVTGGLRLAGGGALAGYSLRYTELGAANGQDAWVWDGTTRQVGLTGAEFAGSGGFRFSQAAFLNDAGQAAGYSTAVSGVSTDHGRGAWVWDGVATRRVGLLEGANVGSAGYRYSDVGFLNSSGQAAGSSLRVTGERTGNGLDAWVWDGAATRQVGFTGAGFTSSSGRQQSEPLFQNDAGQVTGYSQRYTLSGTSRGQSAWVWDPVAGTREIGLVGDTYTSAVGERSAGVLAQNGAGQVAGTSRRMRGGAGVDAWVWNGLGTQQIGLTGGIYTFASGTQNSAIEFQNDAGQVVGYSQLAINESVNGVSPQHAWAWESVGGTRLIGLTGAGYATPTGYAFSDAQFQSRSGQVAGVSNRYETTGLFRGRDAWVWDGGQTHRVGLVGPEYQTADGSRFSFPLMLNEAGQVVGYSNRGDGRAAWAWSGSATERIGLVGGVHADSMGTESSEILFQNGAGRVVGTSRRYDGATGSLGQDAWMWDGAATRPIGLTGGVYTSTTGLTFSTPRAQDEAGRVVGESTRYTGASTGIGQDAWYFDPASGQTFAIVGSVRSSDQYAYAAASLLTGDGFLLGSYQFFDGGVGDGETRAFIYRPDLGMTDLGNLVSGGLGASGWRTLQTPLFAEALRMIVGLGAAEGQVGGQGVFVMVPGPGGVGLAGAGLMGCLRRRRRTR